MTEVRPVRLVRSRAKGSKLRSPNALPVACVTRGTKWGNPFRLEDYLEGTTARPAAEAQARARVASLRDYRRALREGALAYSVADVKRELRGKNLACWCKLEEPCHADILLQLANGQAPGGSAAPKSSHDARARDRTGSGRARLRGGERR